MNPEWWKILRPKVWLWRRQFLGGRLRDRVVNLSAVGLLVAAVLAAAVWLGLALGRAEGARMAAAMTPTVGLLLVMFVLIQLADILQQLFLAPDLPWALRAPVSRGGLFVAKLVECSLMLALPAFFVLGLAITLGVSQGAGWAYYPLAALAVVSMALAATGLGMVLVLFIGSIFPPKRLRELLPVGFGVLALSNLIWQRQAIAWGTGKTAAIQQMLEGGITPQGMLTLTGGALCAALVVCGAAFGLMSLVYGRIYSALQVVGPGRPPKAARAGANGRWRVRLPGAHPAIVEKEWLTLTRDTRQLTSLVLIPLMMVVIVWPIVSEEAMGMRSLVFWVALAYGGMFSINSAESLALPAFMQEGSRVNWYRLSPVDWQTVLWSKLWVCWGAAAAPWGLVLTIGGLLLGLPAWQVIALLVNVGLGLAGVSAVCLSLSARSADFSSATVKTKASGGVGWKALLWGGLWQGLCGLLVVGGAAAFGLARAEMTAVLEIVPPAWITTGGWMMLVISLVGMAWFIGTVGRMWRRAIRDVLSAEAV